MMKNVRLFRKKRAFTLIELIMTIVVVGVVALPIANTLFEHIQSVFISHDYTVALNLARLDMETVINTAYADIAGASLSNYQGYSGYNLSRSVDEETSGAQGYKIISISITKSGSADALATLKTYITKNITWGL